MEKPKLGKGRSEKVIIQTRTNLSKGNMERTNLEIVHMKKGPARNKNHNQVWKEKKERNVKWQVRKRVNLKKVNMKTDISNKRHQSGE